MKHILIGILSLFIVFSSSIQSNAQSLADFNKREESKPPVSWEQSSKKIGDNEYELIFKASVEEHWHFYSQYTQGTMPLMFFFDEPQGYEAVGELLESPEPKEKYDDLLGGLTKYWDKEATLTQKIKITTEGAVIVKGVIDYQACIEGACSQLTYEFEFNLEGTKAGTTEISETKSKSTKSSSEEDDWLMVFLVAFGAGMLALITPCVFPMIPMTVSFFMKGNKSKAAGRKQAIFFGVSIISIFTLLGLILTITLGEQAMYIISTHWVPNTIFFIIFMVFALSFFGLFEITLPSGLINKSDEQADKGGYLGTFFVAFTTVLVSFSCTGPILGAALIELSTGSDNSSVFLISMIGFALGFALPFALLAYFPSALSKLKSGSWLNTVKIVFGFIEIALGLKFLSMADLSANWGILDRETFLALWIVVFAMLGFYLLGKLKFKGDSDLPYIGVSRLFLSIVTFSFVVYMIPGLWGAPLKVLSGYVPPLTTQDFDINRIIIENAGGSSGNQGADLPKRKYTDELHMPTGFDGFFDLDEAKAYAKKVNKPIFVDFTGKTCANCREMEYNVWTVPSVKKMLNEDFVMVALYADANFIKLPEEEWIKQEGERTIKTLGKKNLKYQIDRFKVSAQPYYVIMDSDENVLTKENAAHDKDYTIFENFLTEGLENYKKK